jgi:hypothetical protein
MWGTQRKNLDKSESKIERFFAAARATRRRRREENRRAALLRMTAIFVGKMTNRVGHPKKEKSAP